MYFFLFLLQFKWWFRIHYLFYAVVSVTAIYYFNSISWYFTELFNLFAFVHFGFSFSVGDFSLVLDSVGVSGILCGRCRRRLLPVLLWFSPVWPAGWRRDTPVSADALVRLSLAVGLRGVWSSGYYQQFLLNWAFLLLLRRSWTGPGRLGSTWLKAVEDCRNWGGSLSCPTWTRLGGNRPHGRRVPTETSDGRTSHAPCPLVRIPLRLTPTEPERQLHSLMGQS